MIKKDYTTPVVDVKKLECADIMTVSSVDVDFNEFNRINGNQG